MPSVRATAWSRGPSRARVGRPFRPSSPDGDGSVASAVSEPWGGGCGRIRQRPERVSRRLRRTLRPAVHLLGLDGGGLAPPLNPLLNALPPRASGHYMTSSRRSLVVSLFRPS